MTHKHDKSSMLSQGVFIFVYLAVLTLLEFGVALTFNSTFVLVAVAAVKAVLVVYYYMHIYKLGQDDHGEERATDRRQEVAERAEHFAHQMRDDLPVRERAVDRGAHRTLVPQPQRQAPRVQPLDRDDAVLA